MNAPLIMGLLLGWGAAIPIGPINIEIIRRNLRHGPWSGFFFGLGACSADIFYFVLSLASALILLTQPTVMHAITVIGGCILFWFAYKAFFAPVHELHLDKHAKKSIKLGKQWFSGLCMTVVSPFTILFWASISTQVVRLANNAAHHTLALGLGVIMGIISWDATFNYVLSLIRHKVSIRGMKWMNRIGGMMIAGFALYTLSTLFYL